jgi:hypothetical protein
VNILQAHLDDREDRRQDEAEADRRWLTDRGGIDPAERLLKWDAWLSRTLRSTLQWPSSPAARERLIGQCMAEITTMVRHLAGRGWLLDGDALAAHVRTVLAPIATAQKAGKIGDFYPYFRAAVSRYVGANAEEIQAQARRTGADEGARTVGEILSTLRIRGASMTSLLAQRSQEVAQAKAETLRAKQARARAQQAACKADAQQPRLF